MNSNFHLHASSLHLCPVEKEALTSNVQHTVKNMLQETENLDPLTFY